MKLPNWALTRLLKWADDKMTYTKPNRRIPPDNDRPVYMWRWWIMRVRWFMSIYLNDTRRSDEERALHDHPWINMSIVLRGGYWEHMPGGKKSWRAPGDIVIRWRASWLHRLELAPKHATGEPWNRNVLEPSLSLFITGPALRRWGFQTPDGWVDAKDFDQSHEISDPIFNKRK